KRRVDCSRHGRVMKVLLLEWGLLLGGLPVLSGCGSGEQETSAPPPAPAQVAAPERGPRRDEEEEAEQAAAAEPAAKAPFDLSYLDSDSELFIFARPADIAASPFVQSLTGGNLGPLDQ